MCYYMEPGCGCYAVARGEECVKNVNLPPGGFVCVCVCAQDDCSWMTGGGKGGGAVRHLLDARAM